MRHRTKTHLLTQEQILEFLHRAEVGRMGTFSKDGFPYVVPMHFVYIDNKIYLQKYTPVHEYPLLNSIYCNFSYI